MRKVLVSVGLFATVTFGLVASGVGGSEPEPNMPGHTGTACATVLSRNPNTGPGGHISATGGEHFAAVGAALCGLPKLNDTTRVLAHRNRGDGAHCSPTTPAVTPCGGHT